MPLKVSIHQPEYLPWLGFFDKVDLCDCFVLLDTVQFRKNYFQNRNRIRVDTDWRWLTVPVAQGPHTRRIGEVEIAPGSGWAEEHWKHLQLWYHKAPYFSDYAAAIEEVYRQPYQYLSQLNIELIRALVGCFGIKTELVVASQLNCEPGEGGTEVNLNICKILEAGTYLSGQFGRNYLDEQAFAQAGIAVEYQEFHHPTYRQLFTPFVEGMSAVDLLFNEGTGALARLREFNRHARD